MHQNNLHFVSFIFCFILHSQCWGWTTIILFFCPTPFPTIPMLGTHCCCNVILFYVGNKRCIVLHCIVHCWEETLTDAICVCDRPCSSFVSDEVAVIDEIQMMRDNQRGWAWTRALLGTINTFYNLFRIFIFSIY